MACRPPFVLVLKAKRTSKILIAAEERFSPSVRIENQDLKFKAKTFFDYFWSHHWLSSQKSNATISKLTSDTASIFGWYQILHFTSFSLTNPYATVNS